MLFLLQRNEIDTIGPLSVEVVVTIDDMPSKIIKLFPDIQLLRMIKSRWHIAEMFNGNSINFIYKR